MEKTRNLVSNEFNSKGKKNNQSPFGSV